MTAISAICHPLPRVPLIRIPKDLSWVIPAHPRLAWSSATAATKLSKSVQLPPFLTGRKITHFTIYSPFCQRQISFRSPQFCLTPQLGKRTIRSSHPLRPSILGIWNPFSRALFLLRGRQSSRCGMLAQGDQPFRPADVLLSPDWRLVCEGITNGWFV